MYNKHTTYFHDTSSLPQKENVAEHQQSARVPWTQLQWHPALTYGAKTTDAKKITVTPCKVICTCVVHPHFVACFCPKRDY